ncbi:MAG TPA: endonuclease/exonuclease/phosphatase family protein [Solirubrobacterales bacterium]|nr:endonuclease/exonuclease/phosphatase family protein [Solirubrobacterales bacterium]
MSPAGRQNRHGITGAGRYWAIWLLVAPLVLWTLIRIFGLDRGVPLVPLMSFTPYVAIAALLVAGVATALRNWAAATVAALATLCLAAAVLPRAVGDGTAEAAGHETVGVLSANVYRGKADPRALVELVDRNDVDLLSVQELTPRFARELHRAGIDRRLPEAVEETRKGAAGGGIYSRLPIEPIAVRSPSFFRQPRVLVRLPDGRLLRVGDVHPLTPGRTGIDAWEDSLGDLPATGEGTPWVLIGDFNATLDHSRLREVLDRGYRDAGDVAGQGLVPTWPNRGHTLGPFITIDHVLADERLGIVDYGVEDLPGSDHRSIHAELALPGGDG